MGAATTGGTGTTGGTATTGGAATGGTAAAGLPCSRAMIRSWAAARASLRRASSSSRSGVYDVPLSSSRGSSGRLGAEGLLRAAALLPLGGAMVQNVDALLDNNKVIITKARNAETTDLEQW